MRHPERLVLLAKGLQGHGWNLAVAESLTGGMLAAYISSGPEASEWFKGGVVAYRADVKQRLLGASNGPVVTQRCACEMARGVRALMDAHLGLAVTGVGGPGPSEGHEPGTVWLAVASPMGERSQLVHLRDRQPSDVCRETCRLAIELVIASFEPIEAVLPR